MKRAAAGLALCALVVGCGGEGSKESVPKQPPPELASRCAEQAQGIDEKPFWFRAKDKALLDGVAIGDGDVAVVLAHGYPADLCGWLSYAKTLASRGYLAFAFDFRGLGLAAAVRR